MSLKMIGINSNSISVTRIIHVTPTNYQDIHVTIAMH